MRDIIIIYLYIELIIKAQDIEMLKQEPRADLLHSSTDAL